MDNRISGARRIKETILDRVRDSPRVPDRDRKIIRRVLDGETYDAVGADFGLSREGIRIVCFRAFRRLGFKL
jgi:DNA-directed RNA polymerase sigma subunit (sigma70/sigma32)